MLVAAVVFVAAMLAAVPHAFAGKADRELAPGVFYDAYLNFEITTERNYDLDRSTADGLISTEPELGFALHVDPGDWFSAVVSFELSRLDRLENDRNRRDKGFEFTVKEAYADIPGLFSHFMLRVGRQDFDDELEWLYDQEMDAVRLFYENGSYEAEFAVSQEHLVDVDLLNDDKSDKITNYLGFVRRRINKDTHVDAYVFYRDEHSFRSRTPEDLLFFGIQSLGQIDAVEYWFNAAYVTGDFRGSDISGFGVDVGGTYVFEQPYQPSVTLGAAFGSGDSDPSNGKDSNFRQTGLQDNSQRFNGVENFKYLGELFEPELSNMWVFTLGTGIRPTEKSSIDIVYHYYRQVEADDDIRDSNIRLDPDGTHKSLGHELDVILGYREIEDIDIGLVFGVFLPGKAFGSGADNAYFGNFEISFAL